MKRTQEILLSALLAGIALATVSCGSAYEGAATVVEKDENTRYAKIGKVRQFRYDYEVKICPKGPGEFNERESTECFWVDVTHDEYNDINVNDVVEYAEYSIQR